MMHNIIEASIESWCGHRSSPMINMAYGYVTENLGNSTISAYANQTLDPDYNVRWNCREFERFQLYEQHQSIHSRFSCVVERGH